MAFSGNFRLQKANILINTILDRGLFTEWKQTFRIENKKKKVVDWQGGVRLNTNFTNYKLQKVNNQNFVDYTLFTDFIWPFAKGWVLEINLEHQRYSRTTTSPTTHFNFINTTLTKSFFDNQLSFYVKGVNLLNENLAIQRNSIGNQYSEVTRNRLGRFIMIGAIYKIRSFGK